MSAQSLKDYFSQELSRVPAAKIIFYTHRQADPDALCSASGLGELLVKSFPDSTYQIIVPQGASLLGQSICSRLGITFSKEVAAETIQNSNFLIIVDTGDPTLLEPFSDRIAKSPAKKILVDHHLASADVWKWIDRSFLDKNATSTCEIVALGYSDGEFPKNTAQTLLTGIMFDSQHLGIATASTLEAALVLVKSGAEIDRAKKTLRSKPERSELLARVKSAQRVQYEEVEKFLFLKSEVSSFQASVARMLLEIGGDVGISYGQNEGEARLSVRSSQTFFKETGIDLGELMKSISIDFGLVAGGHPTAASLSGKAAPSDVVSELISRIKARLLKT